MYAWFRPHVTSQAIIASPHLLNKPCSAPIRHRISEKGTLQLSIDCDSLKRALADFPKMARPVGMEQDLPGYSGYIEREMGTVVNTVKVRGTGAQQGARGGGKVRACRREGIKRPM